MPQSCILKRMVEHVIYTFKLRPVVGRMMKSLPQRLSGMEESVCLNLKYGDILLQYVMRSSKMSLKSKNMTFSFLTFVIRVFLGFDLVKTPWRMGNWFQRYKHMKDFTNSKKQRNLSPLFGCILKTIFASSNSFAWSHHIC